MSLSDLMSQLFGDAVEHNSEVVIESDNPAPVNNTERLTDEEMSEVLSFYDSEAIPLSVPGLCLPFDSIFENREIQYTTGPHLLEINEVPGSFEEDTSTLRVRGEFDRNIESVFNNLFTELSEDINRTQNSNTFVANRYAPIMLTGEYDEDLVNSINRAVNTNYFKKRFPINDEAIGGLDMLCKWIMHEYTLKYFSGSTRSSDILEFIRDTRDAQHQTSMCNYF